MNTEKVLIKFNETAFDDKKSIYDLLCNDVQNVVDTFKGLNVDLLPTELHNLFCNTDELLFDKLTVGKDITLAGLKVSKAKALEIIEKPLGYNTLITAIKQCLHNFSQHEGMLHNTKINAQSICDYFILNDEGVIVLNERFIKRLRESYSFYAITERAKNLVAFQNDLIDLIAKHNLTKVALYKEDAIYTEIIKQCLEVRNLNNTGYAFYLNEDGIRRANSIHN